MPARLLGRRHLAALLLPLAGCVPTADQQAAAFSAGDGALALRARQSRRFDTADRTFMLQAAIGTLQDLGFTIEETQMQAGVIVGSRFAAARVRAQILLQPAADQRAIVVRASFQRSQARPGAMLAMGESLDDPGLTQGFFEKLAQSAFLSAHEI